MPKKADWVQYDKDEIEKLVVKLAKEGKTDSQIGMIMRDQYGIPKARKFGLRVANITNMHEKKEIPEDMFSLLKQVVVLHRHMEMHKYDSKAKHGLEKLESRVRRLGKYYVKKGKLPKSWRYSIETARLLVK
ncbi:MAG: 30S ribosomal protein S15 [Candidatus Aenigmarchaeota archaeon]|nr:30S ribosomal protein S15 [Candidatus Aenigmarchaeota archaeon]